MYRFLLLLSFLATALSVPLDQRQSAPSVTIKNGTIVGSSSLGVDSFKAIPYAQPPIGNLRLRPPQSVNKNFGTFQATGSPQACPQFLTQGNTGFLPTDVATELLNSPLFQKISNAGEDCLTIDVQRPSTANSTSKLPVLFWIYGGGFEAGSTGKYDGASIIRKSIDLKEPIVYVDINYRLGGFGFLAGQELADEHSTNLGLRDQRLALQWVAENIAAFGGDPDRVTIWGESAGSLSVYDHTIINGGDNTYNGRALFRGAMMDSGSIFAVTNVTSPKPQHVFDTVAKYANCSDASDKLSCLRGVDYTTFLNAASSVPALLSYRALDVAYLPRPDTGDNFFTQSPEIPITTGQYAKVPIIIGDQEDEGTASSLLQLNLTNNADLISYLSSYFPSNPNANQSVTNLVSNYPDEPTKGQPSGSPFRTGGLNNIYPEYKRLAAILGDLYFTIRRRTYLHAVSQTVPSWSYLATYLHGTPVLGTFHSSDIPFAFGLTGDANVNPVTNAIQTYYISFVNHLDPNAISTGKNLTEWPQWTDVGGKTPQMLNFELLGNSIMDDDFRQGAYEFLLSAESEFRL